MRGLIEAKSGTGTVDNGEMQITPAGQEALRTLLRAGRSAPSVVYRK